MIKRILLFLTALLGINFLVGCGNTEGNKVITSIQKNKQSDLLVNINESQLEGEISISTFYEHEYLVQAAKAFEQKYPKTSIKINTFTTPMPEIEIAAGSIQAGGDLDPNHTIENYLTYLNTAFMSRKVEDMILTDFLPVYKYAESGYLMDLTSVIENDHELTEENYYVNVIHSMKHNNKIYSFPMSYSIPFVSINGELFERAGLDSSILKNDVWNITLMKQLVEEVSKKINDKVYMEARDGFDIFTSLMALEEDRFINLESKTVDVVTDDFVSLLEQCKMLEAQKYIDKEADDEYVLFSIYAGSEANAFQQDFYIYPGHQGKKIGGKPLVSERGDLQIAMRESYAISNSSNNKSLCWAFMKFMMSEEMQKSASLTGFAVNKKAEADRCRYFLNDWVKRLTKEGAVFNITEEEMLNNYQKNMRKWSGMINKCNRLTDEIGLVIHQEIKPFFEGKETARNAARSLQNKLYVMLNE